MMILGEINYVNSQFIFTIFFDFACQADGHFKLVESGRKVMLEPRNH